MPGHSIKCQKRHEENRPYMITLTEAAFEGMPDVHTMPRDPNFSSGSRFDRLLVEGRIGATDEVNQV